MKKFLSLLLALSMMLVLLASCSSSTDSSDTSSDETETTSEETSDEATETETDTTLVIGTTTAPITFECSSSSSNPYLDMVFNTLVGFDENGDLVEMLASSYEYVDSLTLKLTIRDDVYFTEGQQLTADDVLYSLRWWSTESVHSESFSAYDLDSSYTDGNDVYIIYTSEYGPALTDLTNYYIFCEEWVESVEDEVWWDSPNGTGAYICTANVDGQYTSFERKDEWWGDLPECTEVTYQYYGDASAMYIALEQGEIDMAYSLTTSDAERLISGEEDNTDLVAYVQEINSNAQVKLCESCEYWDNELVREAFALCLDYEAIATATFGSLWTSTSGSCLSEEILYFVELDDYETDVDRALELMAEAGYEDGFTITAIVVESAVDMATAVQACAAQIGITIEIESYEPSVAVPKWQAEETDIYISAGAESNATKDPYSSLNIFSATTTMTACKITDEEYCEYYDAGLYSVDEDTRAEAYESVQEWIRDTYWLITVCDAERCSAYDSTKISSVYFANPGRPVVTYIHFA